MVESNKFHITSNSFKDGAVMDKKYTKYGNNVSPHMTWKNVPNGTKSFVLVMDDPDAKPGYLLFLLKIKNYIETLSKFKIFVNEKYFIFINVNNSIYI